MGDGLLSGLEAFGISGLEGMSLYEEEKKDGKPTAEPVKSAVPVITEKDFLLDKTFKCPLCDTEFKNKIVKTGKAKLDHTDRDLRPVYKELDVTKYDVVSCPCCGYTALTGYFPNLIQIQATRIKEKISRSYVGKPLTGEIYSYDEALERYKLALVNAVVKGAKASEKAYICLKAAWVARGKCEEIGQKNEEYAKIKALENEYLKNAYTGFVSAVGNEYFPMCGMDEITVDYIIAVLAIKTGNIDVSKKMISTILQSRVAKDRMKEMARDLKEEIDRALKANGAL